MSAGSEALMADAVVVTADLPTAYRTLLPDLRPPRAARGGRYSPSAAVWHLGVRGTPPEVTAHHNIHFGRAWHSAFSELIGRRELMSDPSRMVTVPTVDAPTMAPRATASCTCSNRCRTWRVARTGPPRAEAAGAAAGIPAAPRLPHRHRRRDPRHASGLGRAGHGRRDAVQPGAHLRPDGPVPTLQRGAATPRVFLAGTGTTPGVGIPMVLISGELAARRVRHYLGATR
ncbi:hypothetical protein [Tessaracoccus coleopterorum]|uniref:hypothetical protein n=1 Tax=Tessaracoccus coleopterorum TaxID=2714950 RepID=UPI0018D3A01A